METALHSTSTADSIMRIMSTQTFLPHNFIFHCVFIFCCCFAAATSLSLGCFCVVDLCIFVVVSVCGCDVCALYYGFRFAWWETFDWTNTHKASALHTNERIHCQLRTQTPNIRSHQSQCSSDWSWLLNIWNRMDG